MSALEKILGPRTPRQELRRRPLRYLSPALFFVAAALCLVGSFHLPYWKMKLIAPQYPKGLTVSATLDRVRGDVAEIDGLNHYIGMKRLADAAPVERSMSWYAVVALAALVVVGALIHNRRAVLTALPALLMPALFLLDLQLWLRHYGLNLDPHAPLSSSIKPFVPPALGVGKIGQFATVGTVDAGFWLACLASLLIVVGFVFHRRAYKPLVEAAAG